MCVIIPMLGVQLPGSIALCLCTLEETQAGSVSQHAKKYLCTVYGSVVPCMYTFTPSSPQAVGQMVYVLKDRMDLEPVLGVVRSNLPTGKEPAGKSVLQQ